MNTFNLTLARWRASAATAVLALGLIGAAMATSPAASAALGAPEKEELKLGFIKLTDMAPLAVAYEKGYFEDEGLYVTLEAQANWKVLFDRVVTGELDGAHMLAAMPLVAATGTSTAAEIISPLTCPTTAPRLPFPTPSGPR